MLYNKLVVYFIIISDICQVLFRFIFHILCFVNIVSTMKGVKQDLFVKNSILKNQIFCGRISMIERSVSGKYILPQETAD